MASQETVVQLLAQSLNFREAKIAEANLAQLELTPGFPVLLLQIVANDDVPLDTRLAGALFFKNMIKRKWNDADGNYLLNLNDVNAIKSNIIELMIAAPQQPRKQLGEAVSVIAASDFPERWEDLVPSLVSRLDISKPDTNNTVLSVAHNIFERWRSLSRSDALFLEIKLVLSQFAAPYLAFMEETDRQIEATQSVKWIESMDLLVRIFYDLNCQDLPEFFEDNITQFMNLLLKYLTPQLSSTSDDDDFAGPGENLRTGICEALTLYTERYEEEFSSYMPGFVEASWTLLTNTGTEAKYDLMVNRCLTFLTSVAKFERNVHMFNSEQILVQIVEQIVVPNIQLRESDMEIFEDEPLDFVRRDLEGNQNDTRRQASTVFLRELAGKLEGEVTKVVMRYVDQFLSVYEQNPSSNWQQKSTAVALFSAIAAKGQITSAGVSTTNLLIDVIAFFNKNMAPELMNNNGATSQPLLRVDAIRFIYSFRNQLTKDQLVSAIPMLVSLISRDQHPTVYTYAAITMERILALRDPVSKQQMFGENDVRGHVKEMSTYTLKVIATGSTKPEELAANEFLMRFLMRVLIVSGNEVAHVADIMVPQLVQIVQAVSTNPSNPKFNHYLFESLGACLKFYKDYNQLSTVVIAPLFNILGNDVTEFVPYVLQILTEILALQPLDLPIPPEYQQLLTPILSPQLWEAKGNVPALVGILEAIIKRGPSLVLEMQLLLPLLGVFQNLLASRVREQYAFELLECIFSSFPIANLEPYLNQIAKLLLAKLSKGHNERYALHLTRFSFVIAASAAPLGPDFLIHLFDSTQANMFGELFQSVFVPNILKINGVAQRNITAIGLTKMLCESNMLVNGPYASLWPSGLTTLANLLTKEIADTTGAVNFDIDLTELGFGASFSPLATTKTKPVSPIDYIDVTPRQFFAMEFQKVSGLDVVKQMVNSLPAETQSTLASLA